MHKAHFPCSVVCRCAVITYHIFIVVTVIVRLSCVGVAVSDKVLHSAAERARNCGQMQQIFFSSMGFSSLCLFRNTHFSHQTILLLNVMNSI